jgi:predicted nucleic acid-binding protein
MEIILLDTNVLIEILKGNQSTVQMVESFSYTAISAITVMELYYGALNKAELKQLEKFVALFQVLHLEEQISMKSEHLIKTFAKSHNLDIPDSLIASTALVNGYKFFTYNIKDFRFIDNLELLKVP